MQSPGLYVQTENETVMDILMIDHQMNQQVLAAVSPIEDLVSAVETDYSEYRKHYKKLYDEHPLFDEKFDISYLEYIDLVEQAKNAWPVCRISILLVTSLRLARSFVVVGWTL